MARAIKCIIPSLLVIAAISFAVVYLTHHHHQPCKLGECVVKVVEGFVKGRERRSALTGGKYYSFQGIPYAKPPVGPLRFKDPQPIGHWFGVHDCTREGDACPQENSGSEDCLFLNIYNTQFPDDDIIQHPVMVWFHGGGFIQGSSSEILYGADYLMQHDVVLVTVNYRLGALGFLSVGNEEVPGNAGLKDQVVALKWIKSNIANFGGDPNNITLFGNDAGAASVHYHTLSPMTKGLFKNVIMQSGSALSEWAFQDDCTDRAYMLGHLLGINATKPEALLHFMRSLPVSDIIDMQKHLHMNEDMNRCFSTPFAPCVEVGLENDTDGYFLLENPKQLIESGNFTQVPMIIGIVSNEGSLGLDTKRKIDEFKEFLPYDIRQVTDIDELDSLEQKVKMFYFKNESVGLHSVKSYMDVCGDLEIVNGIQQTLDYQLAKSKEPIYVYAFTFEGKYNYMNHHMTQELDAQLPSGPYHMDEIGYLFHQGNRKSTLKHNSTEVKTINHITKMWTDFAKTNDPNGFHANEYWENTEKDHPRYLEIGELLKMTGTFLVPERMQFWKNIYSSVNA
ncbi:esterase FE4 [Nilaparvata lugens]|uniref:esterase FE4 n=1 Tax=Nilaparvata lugens TaxID=108931 RepID=UPI00193DD31B|nr:esterase FE4 [Nilaparvata lugens]